MKHQIHFDISQKKLKPNTVSDQSATCCPFCKRELIKLENNVLAEEKGRLLIENKFPVLSNCYQTVFVESYGCHDDLSNYSKDNLYTVLQFGLVQWLKMSENPTFQSVLYIKNHGRYSGASIHHPHMQIIGLKDIDYRESIQLDQFEGIPIGMKNSFEWNISTHPSSEFYEFNTSISKKQFQDYLNGINSEPFHSFANAIQNTVHYILNVLNPNFRSYNLAFYEFEDRIYAKIISRGFGNGAVNSVFVLAYNISQTPNNLKDIAEEVTLLYKTE